MIRSFGDEATRDLFDRAQPTKLRRLPSDLIRIAQRKLDMINAATRLDDLRIPPANRLEALKGSLKGFHSIRVSDQFRIVFRWDQGAYDVRFVDYHSGGPR